MTCRPKLFSAAAIGCLLSSAGAAAAQDAEQPVGLEEVVVTAQRREQSLMDVPASVTALSGSELEQRQINEIYALSTAVPNLSVTTATAGADALILGVRGLYTPTFLANADATVGVYIDGMYIARSMGTNVGFIDMDRVEVLSGPQGTLFGRNTIGGAINIVTRKPSYDFEGSVDLGLANYDGFSATVIMNVPFIPDRLSVRLVYDHNQHSGYGRSLITGQEMQTEDRDYVRGSLRFQLNDDIEILQYLDYYRNKHSGMINVVNYFDPVRSVGRAPAGVGAFLATSDTYDNGAGFVPENVGTLYNYIGTLTWDLGPATFKSITSYRHLDFLDGADLDGTPFLLSDVLILGQRGDQITQEFQLNGKAFDDRLDWIVGAYHFAERMDNPSVINISSPAVNFAVPTTLLENNFNAKNKSSSVFAQATYEFIPSWRITVGARYVEDKREITYHVPRTILATNTVVCGLPASINRGGCFFTPPKAKFDYVPWTASLEYKPSDDALFYGKVSKGYRSGGFQQAGNPDPVAQATPFEPESVLSYEVGAKVSMFDNRLRILASAYTSKYNEIQQNIPFIPPGQSTVVFRQINAGEGKVTGGELTVTGLLGETRLTASLGLTDPKFTSGPYEGSEWLNTPKTSFAFSVSHPVHLSWAEINLQADYSWHSKKQFYSDLNLGVTPPVFYSAEQVASMTQDGFGLLNARASFRPTGRPNLEISVWGRNLTDKYYMDRPQSLFGNFFNAFGPGAPRTYGVSLGYDF